MIRLLDRRRGGLVDQIRTRTCFPVGGKETRALARGGHAIWVPMRKSVPERFFWLCGSLSGAAPSDLSPPSRSACPQPGEHRSLSHLGSPLALLRFELPYPFGKQSPSGDTTVGQGLSGPLEESRWDSDSGLGPTRFSSPSTRGVSDPPW
jgi:hypothetical protein